MHGVSLQMSSVHDTSGKKGRRANSNLQGAHSLRSIFSKNTNTNTRAASNATLKKSNGPVEPINGSFLFFDESAKRLSDLGHYRTRAR